MLVKLILGHAGALAAGAVVHQPMRGPTAECPGWRSGEDAAVAALRPDRHRVSRRESGPNPLTAPCLGNYGPPQSVRYHS